jgi:hypothetical protein
MNCPVCQSRAHLAFKAVVLFKYEAEYQVCPVCGYLFTVAPDWLDEAYTNAIASTDTGLVKRNISISAKLACLLYFGMSERGQGRYVDLAGGYGMLTRMMRDGGFNFFWKDKYCTNLLAQGFEFSQDDGACKAVTAFEVLEHVTNPLDFIKNALEESGADTIIFSTVLYEGAPPDPAVWWYYGFSTGQHIGFFKKKTLEVISQKLDLILLSINGLHVFSKNKISAKFIKIVTRPVLSRIGSHYIRLRLGGKTEADRERLLSSLRNPNL